MRLSHLALTVIEDPDHEGAYHWLLLQPAGDGEIQEHSASDSSFPTAHDAFQAGAVCWAAGMNREDEDADPVGDYVGP